MDDQQPKALRLADALDAVPENGADPDLIQESAAELRRLYWDELRVREHRDTLADEVTKLHAEVERLREQSNNATWKKLYDAAIEQRNKAQQQRDELLAALRVAEFAMDNCPLFSKELNAAIKTARAAIAKAEGEQHGTR